MPIHTYNSEFGMQALRTGGIVSGLIFLKDLEGEDYIQDDYPDLCSVWGTKIRSLPEDDIGTWLVLDPFCMIAGLEKLGKFKTVEPIRVEKLGSFSYHMNLVLNTKKWGFLKEWPITYNDVLLGSFSIKRDVFVFENLNDLNIRIDDRPGVYTYLVNHPGMFELIEETCEEVREKFGIDTAQTLALFKDPESDYESLILYIKDYSESFFETLDIIIEEKGDLLNLVPGRITLTKDYRL